MKCIIQWRKMSGSRCGLNTVNVFHGVTHKWTSSVFEVLFLFLLLVMCLLSSIDEIYVRLGLLADDVREAEYYKTCFFSVGVDNFDQLFL